MLELFRLSALGLGEQHDAHVIEHLPPVEPAAVSAAPQPTNGQFRLGVFGDGDKVAFQVDIVGHGGQALGAEGLLRWFALEIGRRTRARDLRTSWRNLAKNVADWLWQ
jgi:hypothetical protein